jgi:hypothetical protein
VQVIEGFTPLWRTPTRGEAVAILQSCRAWTDARVGALTAKEREEPTPLGDGTWSAKDLLGHLATHEDRALLLMGARGRSAADEALFQDVAAFNEHHRQLKAGWSLRKVERDYASTRDELVEAIRAMDEDRWLEKIPAGQGRSARGLVLAKALNGDKYGYCAHDFAHGRGLDAAVARLTAGRA